MQTHRTEDGARLRQNHKRSQHVSTKTVCSTKCKETLTIELKARAREGRLELTHLMVDDRHGGCPRHAELMRIADRDVVESEAGAAEVLRVGELGRRTPGNSGLCQASQAFGTAFLETT